MRTNTTKISHFVIQPSLGEANGKVFVTQPSVAREKKFGKLFGLINIDSSDPLVSEFINLIIQETKSAFYNEMRKSTNGNSTESMKGDFVSLFERALKKTNQSISEFLKIKNPLFKLEEVNVILAVIKNTDLIFTYSGGVDILLIQYRKRNDYVVNSITDTSTKRSSNIHPLNFFGQTLNGKISTLDYVLFCTDNVLDYMSFERIKNFFLTKSLNESALEFKKTLKKSDTEHFFSGMLCAIESKIQNNNTLPTEVIKNFNYKKAAASDSMGDLVRTEQKTEKLLSPSPGMSIKKLASSVKNLGSTFRNKFQSQKQEQKERDLQKIKREVAKKTLEGAKTYARVVSGFGKKALASRAIKNAQSASFRATKKLTSRMSRYSTKNKIIIGIIAIFIVAFIISTSQGVLTKRGDLLEKNNIKIISEITQKKDAATAALIYNDEKSARTSLLEAQRLIDALSEKTKNDEVIKNLYNEITKQLDTLQKLSPIPNPILLANFQNLNQNLVAEKFIVRQGNLLFVHGKDNGSFYSFDTETQIISAVIPAEHENKMFSLARVWNSDSIMLNDGLLMYEFLPKESRIQKIPIDLFEDTDIDSFQFFNNQLYILSPKKNNIFRYRRTNNGFSNSVNWISDDAANLSTARDLIIDGDLYTLHSDGTINKFTRGKKTDTLSNFVDPPLESPTRLKSLEDSDILYILDPPTKRIVTITKNGDLLKQYFSETFDGITDFEVDEGVKKIYILKGASIYGVPME